MGRVRVILLALVPALALLAYSALYSVPEYEQVIITQFGKIEGKPVDEPGLHFKIPFIQRVRRFDKRWLEWDGDPNEIPTKDKKYIFIDTYARWRIKDAVRFYKRLRDEPSAQSRLDDIIDGEVRNIIASHALIDIVRTTSREFEVATEDTEQSDQEFLTDLGREKLTSLILDKASGVMPNYGIELADVRIKRVNYVDSVQEKVFDRMISERKRIAQRYRSEGQGKSAEIRGKLERELKGIESEAYRTVQEIRGRADAEAAAIYAEAYEVDRDLYAFLKTMEAYKKLIDDDTELVLSTEAEVLKYLRRSQ
ncbi:MAG: protease modulator HflC [Myxococcales bacterium]|jgi:membrane protease subunit HflC